MRYQSFDPGNCGFPRPRVPLLPGLAFGSLGPSRAPRFQAVDAGRQSRAYTRGRYALTDAYRLCGVGPGGTLLLPAYHCRSMIDPALRLKAPVLLYPSGADLVPDLEALRLLIAQATVPAKALLVTHYFGFAQRLKPLQLLCADQGIDLIEDCSHAMFCAVADGAAADPAIGGSGRCAVASPYKFYPCEDGGILWSNRLEALPGAAPCPQTAIAEVKGVARSFQRLFARHQLLDQGGLDQQILATLDRAADQGSDLVVESDSPSAYYQPAEEGLQSLCWSRWVARHTHLARLAERRRQNYRRWVQAVAALPYCRALFPELPAGAVPYMFPLLLDHPTAHFYSLKHLGVPIWRWDDIAVSTCNTAADYRLRLLHLPCHQELGTDQIDWMISAVAAVLTRVSGGSGR